MSIMYASSMVWVVFKALRSIWHGLVPSRFLEHRGPTLSSSQVGRAGSDLAAMDGASLYHVVALKVHLSKTCAS